MISSPDLLDYKDLTPQKYPFFFLENPSRSPSCLFKERTAEVPLLQSSSAGASHPFFPHLLVLDLCSSDSATADWMFVGDKKECTKPYRLLPHP